MALRIVQALLKIECWGLGVTNALISVNVKYLFQYQRLDYNVHISTGNILDFGPVNCMSALLKLLPPIEMESRILY